MYLYMRRGTGDLDERGKCKVIAVEIVYMDHFSVFLSTYNLFMGVSQNSGAFQNELKTQRIFHNS